MHYRLAELQTEVELLRALLYRATGVYWPASCADFKIIIVCMHILRIQFSL